MRRWTRGIVLLGALGASSSFAQVFRFSSSGDVLSLDPHSGNEALTNTFKQNTYEGLVRFNERLEPEPALAVSWKNVDPVTWRFLLRRGVTFHDGKPFTADDVVFSLQRQKSKKSGLPEPVATVRAVRKIDDYTVEYVTDGPDPLLLKNLVTHWIMSRRWCEEHNSIEPGSALDQESYSARHENGTGPFQVQERVADTRTILVPFPRWWDLPNKKYALTRAEYRPISSSATRLAALISGEQDFIWPVAPQDVARVEQRAGFRVLKTPEIRVIYLGMDQYRDESLDMPGSGKNPFKDVRVRRAAYQAIDVEAIRTKVMRGMAQPTGVLIAQASGGYDPALRERLPYDPAASKRLLAEAGYPDGFPVTLDCPNDRYPNDEAVCQAMVPMLGRVGIRVALNLQTKSKHFEKMLAKKSAFYLLGWLPPNLDAMATFVSVMALKMPGSGTWNVGQYYDPRFEELASAARVEMNPEKRQRLISEATRLHKEAVGHIPLFETTVAWGVRDGVDVLLDPRDQVALRFVSVRR